MKQWQIQEPKLIDVPFISWVHCIVYGLVTCRLSTFSGILTCVLKTFFTAHYPKRYCSTYCCYPALGILIFVALVKMYAILIAGGGIPSQHYGKNNNGHQPVIDIPLWTGGQICGGACLLSVRAVLGIMRAACLRGRPLYRNTLFLYVLLGVLSERGTKMNCWLLGAGACSLSQACFAGPKLSLFLFGGQNPPELLEGAWNHDIAFALLAGGSRRVA